MSPEQQERVNNFRAKAKHRLEVAEAAYEVAACAVRELTIQKGAAYDRYRAAFDVAQADDLALLAIVEAVES